MRIIITDMGNIWNPDNPFLETVKDIVLVVCLNGKKATDKYECFVSPYNQAGMGIDKYGTESMKLKALASAAVRLNNKLNYHDDIVFLADDEISTLYPFFALKDLNKFNRFHLIASTPYGYISKKNKTAHLHMLSDLSSLTSFFYYDSNRIINEVGTCTMREANLEIRNRLINIMPTVLNGINDMRRKSVPCYFDTASMSYIPLKNGFKDIDISNKDNTDEKLKFEPYRSCLTLGMVIPPSYPEHYNKIHETIEKPVPRPDGKQICDMLREQRILLAKANNIPFESEECPSEGPCAGTCEKCDAEAEFLRRQLDKIPEDQRVYPHFEIDEKFYTVTSD